MNEKEVEFYHRSMNENKLSTTEELIFEVNQH